MTRTHIEERIRKLLRLSQSPNEHEAALAMEMAFELAARHQIEIEALNLNERERAVVEVAIECGLRMPMEKSLSLGILKHYFNVSPVRGIRDVKLVGLPHDVTIALYVLEFLASTARQLVVDRRTVLRTKWTENRRRNFLFGFFYGVSDKLNAVQAQLIPEGSSTALALIDRAQERNAYIADNIGRTKPMGIAKPKRKDRSALYDGYLRGKEIEIRNGVNGAPQPAALASK